MSTTEVGETLGIEQVSRDLGTRLSVSASSRAILWSQSRNRFFLKCGISLIPGLEFCKPLVSVSISSSLERMILDDTEYTGGQGGFEKGKPPLAFKIYTLPLRQKNTPPWETPKSHPPLFFTNLTPQELKWQVVTLKYSNI